MRTCWVIDHPAHARLLAEVMRAGSTADLIVATERPEVRSMLAHGDGRLPRRQTLWVQRPVGEGRYRKALHRLRSVQRFLKQAGRDGLGPVERVVVVGASLELMAAKPRWWRRSSAHERWYISDTEVNHVAHRLALKSATDAVLPTHWREDSDGGFLSAFNGRIHRLDGLHGHVHLAPLRRPSKVSSPPRIVVRRLKGGGVHDGVITQSVTLASEAVLLGTPTLLVSKAERGFLDRLEMEGAPLFRWRGPQDEVAWESVHAQFLAGLHLTDALEPMDWPDARQQLMAWLA